MTSDVQFVASVFLFAAVVAAVVVDVVTCRTHGLPTLLLFRPALATSTVVASFAATRIVVLLILTAKAGAGLHLALSVLICLTIVKCLIVFEVHFRIRPQGLRTIECMLLVRILIVLMEQLTVWWPLLRLVLSLPARLAVLEDAIRTSNWRQKLGFRSVNPLPLLRAVRDHEGMAC